MDEYLSDKEIRERIERQPELWATVRETAALALEEAGEDITHERVDALAVAFLRHKIGDTFAAVEEFIPTEERSRIYKEEQARLSELHPEGFTEEAWTQAVLQRFKEEYPEAFSGQ